MVTIGLGNPGEKFENTRHNAGFMVVDFFASENDFPDFEMSKKLDALISLKSLDTARGKQKVLLAKPQTFMNKSGLAVRKIVSYVKCQMSNVVVIHDDADLPLGKIKFSKNKSAGGHKGVDSVIKNLKTKDFIRLRIGTNTAKRKVKAEKVVLKKFNKDEQIIIKKTIKKASAALNMLLAEGIEKTMNEYNRN